MSTKTVKLERSEDLVLNLPEGFAEEGEKVFISEKDGAIIISKAVKVEIDLDDKIFMQLAKLAHERDITFNELVNELLREYIEKQENI